MKWSKSSLLVLFCAALPACALADSCQPARYAQDDMTADMRDIRDMRDIKGDMTADMRADMNKPQDMSDMSKDMMADMGQQPVLPTLNPNARFGASLSIAAHGDQSDMVWVAAGAPGRDLLSAFKDQPGQVILSLVGRASLSERGGALERGVILTPAGSDSQPGDSFGEAVALSQQGNFLAVGAPSYSEGAGLETGAVFIFERTGQRWTQRAKLMPRQDDRMDYSGFGSSVSISERVDDQGARQATVVVGAPLETIDWPLSTSGCLGCVSKGGAIYIFERTSAGLWERPTNGERFTMTSHNDNPEQVQRLTLGESTDRWYFGHKVAVDGTLATQDVVIAATAPGATAATTPCFFESPGCDTKPNVGSGLVFWYGEGGLLPYGYIYPSKDGAQITMEEGSNFGGSLALRGALPYAPGQGRSGAYTLLIGAPTGQALGSPQRGGLAYLIHEEQEGIERSGCILDLFELSGATYPAQGAAFATSVALSGQMSAQRPATMGCSDLYQTLSQDMIFGTPTVSRSAMQRQGGFYHMRERKMGAAPWPIDFGFEPMYQAKIPEGAVAGDELGRQVALHQEVFAISNAQAKQGRGEVFVGRLKAR